MGVYLLLESLLRNTSKEDRVYMVFWVLMGFRGGMFRSGRVGLEVLRVRERCCFCFGIW